MRVHFIAIGGSAMHNMAIALHKNGFKVSGSDDEVFEPSKSRLKQYGLLPEKIGWSPERIDSSIDAIILGMHAKKDNPELVRAQKEGIKVYSYPEYIYEQSKEKKRIVIGGSHGKTSITSMIMHVLKVLEMDFDYMVGSQLEGFDTMVRLSDAPIIIIEGDEYLSSPIDRRPKFLWYHPHIAVISGIAWDHVNVFPTFENYLEQFEKFIQCINSSGTLIYCDKDETLNELVKKQDLKPNLIPYHEHPSSLDNGITLLETSTEKLAIKIFGQHNLENLMAAMNVCLSIGIGQDQFYTAIQSFKGAAKRLELIGENDHTLIYKDYAHSPSKLRATVSATKKQYPDKKLIACMELHTFSSLTKAFLKEYSGSMNAADEAIVYFNPKAIEHKGLQGLNPDEVKASFLPSNVTVFDDSSTVKVFLRNTSLKNSVLLLMTSGDFDGIDLNELGKQLTS